MPITVKHGAELEGRGLAYGAAAKAAYIRQQEEEQKEEQKKAKRLGNIGSALSTAGAVATFIPGLQPVGVGLSIAGGALGSLAGGAGDPGGKAVAMTAQGISQVYQAQQAKVEARQEEWDKWKERSDYTQELSALSKQQTLDREIEVRDRGFIELTRGQNQKYMDQKNAVLSAVGLDAFKAYELDALEEASMNTGQYGNALRQVIPKLKELQQEHRATLQQIRQFRQDDPTSPVEEFNRRTREEAETRSTQLKKEAETFAKKAEEEVKLAANRDKVINDTSQTISAVDSKISKALSAEEGDSGWLDEAAVKSLENQKYFAEGQRSIALEGQVRAIETNILSGDKETFETSKDLWVENRTEELLAEYKALMIASTPDIETTFTVPSTGQAPGFGGSLLPIKEGDKKVLRSKPGFSEEKWAAELGGLYFYYKNQAHMDAEKLYWKNRELFIKEISQLTAITRHGGLK